jgi:hypothetical protein
MDEVMRRANSPRSTSMLVRIPVYRNDDLGQNPRLEGLKSQGTGPNL